MYRNLSPSPLGISARQSEVIELALTHGYKSIDIDIEEFTRKVLNQKAEQATRLLASAQLKIGSFELPIKWRGEEGIFKAELVRLDAIAQHLSPVGGDTCLATVYPGNDSFGYPENFELHCSRLVEIGEVLGRHNMKLAVGFITPAAERAEKTYPFIQDAEALITLLKSVTADNVGLHLDTWDWHVSGGTVAQVTELGAERVFSVSLADASPGLSPETATPNSRTLPNLTDGVVGVPEYVKALEASPAPVTMRPDPDTLPSFKRNQMAEHVAKLFDELWIAAGITQLAHATEEDAAAS